MLIRFDELEPSVVSHMKGGEGEARLQLVQDMDNKIMRSVLAPGASIGLHTHETSSEVMYFLSGTGKVLYDGVWEPVAPGTCHLPQRSQPQPCQRWHGGSGNLRCGAGARKEITSDRKGAYL